MPWRRYNRHKGRSTIRRLLAALFGITLIVVGWLWYHSPATTRRVAPADTRQDAGQPHAGLNAAPAMGTGLSWPQRPVYPYSVIPGGIRSIPELKEALLRDPVAAAHYARFDISRSRMLELQSERTAYVSYRIKDHVYWTSRRLRLLPGETIITDGVNYARARCGNRISEVPRGEQSPREPTAAELEQPVVLSNQTVAPIVFAALPQLVPPEAGSAVPQETTWAAPPFDFITGASAPVAPRGGGSTALPSGFPTAMSMPPVPRRHPDCRYPLPYRGAPCKPPHPSPTVVPEPSGLLLISTGVGLVALWAALRKRSHRLHIQPQPGHF